MLMRQRGRLSRTDSKFAVPHPARLDAAPHVDQQEQLRRLHRAAMVPFPDELREVGELLPLLAAEHFQWSRCRMAPLGVVTTST